VIFRRCPTQLCKHRVMPGCMVCRPCWTALPTWLRRAITEERDNCRLSGIKHSQELHALRDQAVQLLSDRNRDRFAKPQGVQLPLPT
jgi:hypothetical protein